MEKASNHYKTLMTKKMWEAPTPEQEKLISPQARMNKFKKNFSKKYRGMENESGSVAKKLKKRAN